MTQNQTPENTADHSAAPRYVLKSIKDLAENPRNARTHSEAQIKKIADCIRSFEDSDFAFCVENDCYAVCKSGNVYRVCREQKSKSGNVIRKYETIPMRGSFDRDGYRTYRMRVDEKKMHVKGHRIVLNAFCGVQKNLVANHIDGNKKNNSLSNLEWVSVAQNNNHAIKTGLLDPRLGGKKNAKIDRESWASIFIEVKKLGVSRVQIAKRNGVCRQTIDLIIRKVSRELESVCLA